MSVICLGHRQLGDRHFDHGAEIDPGLLEGELLSYFLDHKWCMETPDRRSLYRLFHCFSGCKEREALNQNELAMYEIAE